MARTIGMKGTDGFGCPAIVIGAVGSTAITCAAAVGIVRTRGIITGITAIMIDAMIDAMIGVMIDTMIAVTIAVGIAIKASNA